VFATLDREQLGAGNARLASRVAGR
jgi:hypothetical protein